MSSAGATSEVHFHSHGCNCCCIDKFRAWVIDMVIEIDFSTVLLKSLNYCWLLYNSFQLHWLIFMNALLSFWNITPHYSELQPTSMFINILHSCIFFNLFISAMLLFLFPSLSLSITGGNSSSRADFCQSNIQFFPGHAAVLLSVSGSLIGLFPSTACDPAESVLTSSHSDWCSHPVGGCGSVVCYTVRCWI